MTLLIIGVLLWLVPHFFKRVAPQMRARLGAKAKGPISLMLLASIVLMVIGFRSMELIPLYTPIPGMGHFNNLMMVPAIYLTGIGGANSLLVTKIRHPMLIGVGLWAVLHLLVNGDLASVILFGSMLFWAVAQILLINRAEGEWKRPPPGTNRGEAINIGATIVLMIVISLIHIWLGHNPFLGTYT